MSKQNLFSLVAFFCSVSWLALFGMQIGVMFMICSLGFVTVMNILYNLCKKDAI
jgi:hypothetical protein